MNWILPALALYILAQLGIGWWVSRRIRTEEDYLVAGRRLGYGLTTFTLFATWFGAETCIGAAGVLYDEGLSGASADHFGYGECLLLLGVVFAVPLWRKKLTTLADLYRRRYGAGVERLAVLLMVPTSLFWAAAQIRAFGQVLTASSGIELTAAITAAAAVVIVYTTWGGLLADAWTDLIQGTVLIAGLVVLAAVLLAHDAGALLADVEPQRLALFGGGRSALETAEAWAIPVFGSVVAAELAARVLAARSPEVAQRSAFGATGLYLAVGLIPVGIGLIGPQLVPGLAEPEQVLPLVAQRFLPGALYVLFAGALVSAILSTVDSALLTAASLVSHNVVLPLRPTLSERAKVRTARVFVVLFGLAAYAMALWAEGIYALIEASSAFGSAGLFVTLVFGLFTRWGGPASASAAMVAGVAAYVLGEYGGLVPQPFLFSVAAALVAYVGVALAVGTPRAEPAR